jgi:hypothetical protein
VFNFRKRKAEEDEVEKEQKKMSEEWNNSIETRSTAKTYVSLYFIKKTYYQ